MLLRGRSVLIKTFFLKPYRINGSLISTCLLLLWKIICFNVCMVVILDSNWKPSKMRPKHILCGQHIKSYQENPIDKQLDFKSKYRRPC